MADNLEPLPFLDAKSSSYKPTPPSTYEYNSGFSQESFLSDNFNVTKFINTCTAKITQVINDDFNKTLQAIDGNDIDQDSKTESKTEENDDDVDLSSFPAKHLTAENLKQLHDDLSECYENLKQELINSFEQNYPQFLELNQSLTAGTENNLKKCKELLNNIHKKYNAVYQQILRLLERIYSKSKLKANYVSKVNALKQISFVPNMIENIKISLKTLHQDFDPFNNKTNKDKNKLSAIDHFKEEFRKEISNATERRQYRLLQKSCRLERVAILLAKLTAIFKQKELNQHLLVKNKENEFVGLRNRFYNELKQVFIESINCGSLLSLRSNLRCYNYLYDGNNKLPESIVRDKYIKPKICVPLTLFLNRTMKDRREKILNSFDKLYNLLIDKLCILFNKEIMINNDFIADGVWYELVENLFNEDFGESFISYGEPNLFHQHYCAVIIFFRKLQKLYYQEMTCNLHKNHDQYLYFHPSSIKFRKKCNLQRYFLIISSSYITQDVKNIILNKYSNINYHYKIYISYYNKMKDDDNKNDDNDDNDNDDDDNDNNKENINLYLKRLNQVKESLVNCTDKVKDIKKTNNNDSSQFDSLQFRHFEYNYLLPIFQICVINSLKCWDSDKIWIWELSSNFLKLTTQILSFLYNYLNQQINDLSNSSLLIVIHSDLYYFNNWIKYELIPLIKYQFIQSIANIDTQNNIKLLIEKSINSSINDLDKLKIDLLNKRIIDIILNECKSSLKAVDELADSWQANISFINNDNDSIISSQKVSEYVSKLFKPLKEFLMFLNNHSLEHITIQEKNELIWNILNGICNEYWKKIKKVQERLTQIRKIMEKRRRTRTGKNKNTQKSGAERAEYQLFLDCRQFMQQIQGFVNGLQRDEKSYIDKINTDNQQKEKPIKSSIIQIKKKPVQQTTKYITDNLKSWANFHKFVQQFQ